MALILCIETATQMCSVALAEGHCLLALEESSSRFQHASQITIFIDRCLQKAKKEKGALDAIAVSIGPGSYTGLRVGISAAKGLCYALDIPLISIDTLQALAYGAQTMHMEDNAIYCPMIDARRMEVYTAMYDHDLSEMKQAHSRILDQEGVDFFRHEKSKVVLSGDGAAKFKEIAKGRNYIFTDLDCSARFMMKIAADLHAAKHHTKLTYLSPRYLKPPNITIPRKVI